MPVYYLLRFILAHVLNLSSIIFVSLYFQFKDKF
jgi:hypothetical protein